MTTLRATSPVPELEESIELSLDAFVRSIGIKQGVPHTLFLGAGSSLSSGIPNAESCIWEWKRNIFLTNNPGLEQQLSELSLISVRNKIQEWLDRQSIYPKQSAPEEYGFYIEKCFPIAEDRQAGELPRQTGCKTRSTLVAVEQGSDALAGPRFPRISRRLTA